MPKESNATELEFMTALERGEVITQMTLKQRIGVSVGLINALVKRAVKKGYVKACEVPRKRYAYYLTPQGFVEKSRLVAEYLDASLDFFRQAKEQYGEVFVRASLLGMKRIALVGDGELAEIAVLAATSKGMALAAVVDDRAARTVNHGLPIVKSLADLEVVDGLVITDAKTPQETYENLCQQLTRERIMWPDFLHIAPHRIEMIASIPEGGKAP